MHVSDLVLDEDVKSKVKEFEQEWMDGIDEEDFEYASEFSEEDEEGYNSHDSRSLSDLEYADEDQGDNEFTSEQMIHMIDNFRQCTNEQYPCTKKIDQDLLIKTMMAFRSKRVSQQLRRTYIAGLMHSTIRPSKDMTTGDIISTDMNLNGATQNSSSSKQRQKERCNQQVMYCLHRWRICRHCFRFITNVSSGVLEAILKDFQKVGNGFCFPKFKGKSSHTGTKNTLVHTFLKRYQHLHGIPSPSNIKKYKKRQKLYILRRGLTKANVYQSFIEALDSMNGDFNISYRYFAQVWLSSFPYLKIIQKATDFCDQCTMLLNEYNIHRSMIQRLYLEHKRESELERQRYFLQCHSSLIPFTETANCNSQTSTTSALINVPKTIMEGSYKNSFNGIIHLTFDFSPPLYLPHLIKDPGMYYFKNGLNIQLFGVLCETTQKQMTYVLPEGTYPLDWIYGHNKGSNFTISLLHHYLEHYEYGSKHLQLHAMNKGKNSKSSYLIYYLIWRIIMKYEEHIELSFMLPGHSRSLIDYYFTSMKSEFSQNDVLSIQDMVDLNQKTNESHSIHDSFHDQIQFYNWKDLLNQYFQYKSIPCLQSQVMIIDIQRHLDSSIQITLRQHSNDSGKEWSIHRIPEMTDEYIQAQTNLALFEEPLVDISLERKKALVDLIEKSSLQDMEKTLFFNLSSIEEYREMKKVIRREQESSVSSTRQLQEQHQINLISHESNRPKRRRTRKTMNV